MLASVIIVLLTGCDRQRQGGMPSRRQVTPVRNQINDEGREQTRIETEERFRKEAQQQEADSRKKRALKIIELEVAADRKLIETLRHELECVDKDRCDLMTRFDAIEVPKVLCRTNTVTAANGRMRKKVETVKLSEDQRMRDRLTCLYEDQAVRDMYASYTDSTAKKVLDEFEAEWTDANDKYENVTLALQKVDDEENAEKEQLSSKFNTDRSRRVGRYRCETRIVKESMKPLVKKIREHESGRCRIRTLARPKRNGEESSCGCTIGSWQRQLQELERELSDLQSKINAEESTAVGQSENRQIDGVTAKASRKRARINQEYTHQAAILKEIVDKYNRLLMEGLVEKMRLRKEYLKERIAEIVGKNEIKARYLDGRAELSPELALDYIKDAERKNADMLGISRSSESDRAYQRKLDLIKESNTIRVERKERIDVKVTGCDRGAK